jgi:hypothetical protein
MEKGMIRMFFALICGIIFGGCATAYQKQGPTGGYSSYHLAENIFKVTFKGNGFTDKDRASDFALLRSAEVALENGYPFFVIVDERQHSKNSMLTSPGASTTSVHTNTYGTATGYGNYSTYSGNAYGRATTFNSGGQTFLITKPTSTNTIFCFRKKTDTFAYEAKIIRSSIREKYAINEDVADKQPAASVPK